MTALQSLDMQQLALGMQVLPHAFSPVGHVHALFWQVCPATPAQSGSVQHALAAMQRPLHSFAPPPHEHTPLVQVPFVPQSAFMQQPPAAHAPLHTDWPAGHWQVPAWHVWPAGVGRSAAVQHVVVARHEPLHGR